MSDETKTDAGSARSVTCACLNVTLFLVDVLSPAQPEDAERIGTLLAALPVAAAREPIFSQGTPLVAQLDVGSGRIPTGPAPGAAHQRSNILLPEFLSVRCYGAWSVRECVICGTGLLAACADSDVVLIGASMLQDPVEQARRRVLAAALGYLGLYFDPETERDTADTQVALEVEVASSRAVATAGAQYSHALTNLSALWQQRADTELARHEQRLRELVAAETRRFEAARYCAQTQLDALRRKYLLTMAAKTTTTTKLLDDANAAVTEAEQQQQAVTTSNDLFDDLFEEEDQAVVGGNEEDREEEAVASASNLDTLNARLDQDLQVGSLPVAVPSGLLHNQTAADKQQQLLQQDVKLVSEPEFTHLTAEEKLYLIQAASYQVSSSVREYGMFGPDGPPYLRQMRSAADSAKQRRLCSLHEDAAIDGVEQPSATTAVSQSKPVAVQVTVDSEQLLGKSIGTVLIKAQPRTVAHQKEQFDRIWFAKKPTATDG